MVIQSNLAIVLNKGHFDRNEACSLLTYDKYSPVLCLVANCS